MATTKSTSQDLRRALNQMKNKFRVGFYDLQTGSKHLGEVEAQELKSEIERNYDNFISSLSHDHQDHTYHVDIIPRSDGGYDVDVIGTQVIYDEFGTGIVGANNPHPMKSNYNLNAYNTGAKIHHFPDSNKDYWVYFADGRFVTTKGVPAGAFMYNSIMNMAEGIWANLFYEEIFKDFYDTMKGK